MENSRANRIYRPVTGTEIAEVLIEKDGDIHLNPATGKGVFINGGVVFPELIGTLAGDVVIDDDTPVPLTDLTLVLETGHVYALSGQARWVAAATSENDGVVSLNGAGSATVVLESGIALTPGDSVEPMIYTDVFFVSNSSLVQMFHTVIRATVGGTLIPTLVSAAGTGFPMTLKKYSYFRAIDITPI